MDRVAMTLDRIASAVSGCRILRFGGQPDVVTSIALDSRQVEEGALFFALPGTKSDGRTFAADAVARGAVAVVAEEPVDGLDATQLIVPDARDALADIAALWYGSPDRDMKLCGVTGTNGKTTTVRLIATMLSESGVSAASLGTLGATLDGEPVDLHVSRPTTPEAHELRQALGLLRDRGARAVAMEVSSHATRLKRVHGLRFSAAAFTNLTEDHLDFHPDMEDYFAAKAMLFEGLDSDAVAVINIDDEYGRRLPAMTKARVLTYGWSEGADIRPTGDMGRGAIRGTVKTPAGDVQLDMPLVGRFNVANALAAVGVGIGMGLSCDQIGRGLSIAQPVPGRFEPVASPNGAPGPTVVVDYAHTPDALENVLRVAGEMAHGGGGKLVCVVGCGGDRDRKKRPLMGAIAADLADRVVFTSDNPRTEDPEAILDEIVAGVVRKDGWNESRTGARRFVGRSWRRAMAMSLCWPERAMNPYQEIQGVKHQFDDRDEARSALGLLTKRDQ